MAKTDSTAPQTKKPSSPVRLPQRSEEISGDEHHGPPTPIAAAEKATDKARMKTPH